MADYYEHVDIHQVTTLMYGTKNQQCFFGCGAINKIDEIFESLEPSHIGFVTSRSAYRRCGAWEVIEAALQKQNISYTIFDKITANPTCALCEEARTLFGANYDDKFVICPIGGGSPIDAAKCIAILLAHPEVSAKQVMLGEFTPESAATLVAINLTHGTGTEVDRFAVNSILDSDPPMKPCLAHPTAYPAISIDDPYLMRTLNDFQTRYTAIDALNHVMEASTTIVATPFSRTLAKEVCYLIARYLPQALADHENLRARYWLAYAAAIAGMAFDESLLHITHAAEHTLSALVPDLTHGLGLAMIQPAVLRHIWPVSGPIIADIMSPMLGTDFTGDASEAERAYVALRHWLESVGMTETLNDFFPETDAQIQKLVEITHATPGMDGLLALSPVVCDSAALAAIYRGGYKQ